MKNTSYLSSAKFSSIVQGGTVSLMISMPDKISVGDILKYVFCFVPENKVWHIVFSA